MSKVPRTFPARKAIRKLRPAYSVKLVFSYVKGINIKITAKFRASRRLRLEDTKRIMSPEIRPKSFGTFEKQAPGFHLTKQIFGTLALRHSQLQSNPSICSDERLTLEMSASFSLHGEYLTLVSLFDTNLNFAECFNQNRRNVICFDLRYTT